MFVYKETVFLQYSGPINSLFILVYQRSDNLQASCFPRIIHICKVEHKILYCIRPQFVLSSISQYTRFVPLNTDNCLSFYVSHTIRDEILLYKIQDYKIKVSLFFVNVLSLNITPTAKLKCVLFC